MTAPTRWPAPASYALCLTHDVDRVHKYWYHYLHHGVRHGLRGVRIQFPMLVERVWQGRKHYWNFEHIMALEEEYGVRSTFLFLHETARGITPAFWGRYDLGSSRLRSVIKDLDRGGWEIGLHGSFFSYRDAALLGHEKALLEDITSKPVRSTRQHFLNLDPDRTWHIQRAVGLEVDSTVGLVREPWRDLSSTLPYWESRSGMLELPITLMDTIGLHRSEVREDARRTVQAIREKGGLIVLDWHQRTFTPGEWSDAVACYRTIIEQAQADCAWIATMGEILDHWRDSTRQEERDADD